MNKKIFRLINDISKHLLMKELKRGRVKQMFTKILNQQKSLQGALMFYVLSEL
jgi:hypothetical protein